MATLLMAAALAHAGSAAAQPYDVVIRNGRVVDGTGNGWFAASVAIACGRIAAVGGPQDAPARLVIDAAGLVVAPGFIDIHAHVLGFDRVSKVFLKNRQ